MEKEVATRLQTWYLLLHEVDANLLAEKELWEMFVHDKSFNYFRQYEINNRKRNFHLFVAAISSIQTASVVLFTQIFIKGKGGPNIAANQGDAEVDSFRKRMENSAKEQLGWDDEYYKSLMSKIRKVRNKQIAHYDGQDAHYQERQIEGGIITSMKLHGANFNRAEITKFRLLVRAMHKFLDQEFTAHKVNPVD